MRTDQESEKGGPSGNLTLQNIFLCKIFTSGAQNSRGAPREDPHQGIRHRMISPTTEIPNIISDISNVKESRTRRYVVGKEVCSPISMFTLTPGIARQSLMISTIILRISLISPMLKTAGHWRRYAVRGKGGLLSDINFRFGKAATFLSIQLDLAGQRRSYVALL